MTVDNIWMNIPHVYAFRTDTNRYKDIFLFFFFSPLELGCILQSMVSGQIVAIAGTFTKTSKHAEWVLMTQGKIHVQEVSFLLTPRDTVLEEVMWEALCWK